MRLALLFLRMTAIVIAVLIYFGRGPGAEWVKASPRGYYEMLTDAVTSGQTYLKEKPDPRLKTLANPWAGAQGIPRMHDATYFNDRYYLYFGVAPVAVLYAPWRVLTGTYLSDGAGTVFFCCVGFLLSAWLFMRVRARFFPGLPGWWTSLAILTMGLGTFLQHQVQNTEFYIVPISCGFACIMFAANALFGVATSGGMARRLAWLALASLAVGVAVGARPNQVVVALPVALAALFCLVGRPLADRRVPAIGATLVAAILPAALAGLALACYNYARFGDPLDFGIKNQFAAIDMHNLKLFGLEHVRYVSGQYFLAGRDYSLYYPFVRQPTENIGMLPWAPLALVGLAFPLTLLDPRLRRRDWILGVGLPWLAVTVILASLLGYFYVFERYNTDFLPGLVLFGCIVVSAVLAAPVAGWGKRLGLAALMLVVAYTLAHSVARGLPTDMNQPAVRALARTLNRVSYWVESRQGVRYGPLDAKIEFAEGTPGESEPLVVTGKGRDLIFVKYAGPRRAQLGFYHTGSGGPLSDPFDFEPGRPYALHVDLGSFYPPLAHSLYSGWSDDQIEALQRRVDVRLDNRPLLEFSAAFHSAEAGSLQLGRNPDSPTDKAFRGKISAVSRPGVPARTSILGASGPLRLEFEIPPFSAMIGQPLISTGRSGEGDLLFIFYVGPNQVRFGHDSWSRSLFETPAVYYEPGEIQVLDVDMGSLHPENANPLDGREKLQLRFNGRLLADQPRPFHPSSLVQIAIGNNAIRGSTAEVNFNGPRLKATPVASFPMPTGGSILLTVRHPANRNGHQPLLATGQNGAGEVIYLDYVDAGHVRVGYDRWGSGGPMSDPIAFDPAKELEIEMTTGALHPEAAPTTEWDAAAWARVRSTVRVRINGRTVLRTESAPHPTRPDQVYPGANPIGASTAPEKFAGEIVKVERLGVPRL